MALMEIDSNGLGSMKLYYDNLNRAIPFNTKQDYLSYTDATTKLKVSFKSARELALFIGSTTFKIRLTDKQGAYKIYTLFFIVFKADEHKI